MMQQNKLPDKISILTHQHSVTMQLTALKKYKKN